MLIVRLAGGFGNQVFQLGAALLLAEKAKITQIIIDDSALNSYQAKRRNELSNIFNLLKLGFDVNFRFLKITKLRIPKIVQLNLSKFPFVSDENFKVVSSNPNKYFLLLDGYFQWCLNQNDFDEIKTMLKKIFIIGKKSTYRGNACVVHIRGGDFLNMGWDQATPRGYYLKAIELMQTKYGVNNFIVVTDDKLHAKSILTKANCKYVISSENINNDFNTIALFSKRILSSSTFAFWASALGNNINGVVIAPKTWFPGKEREIYLDNEIRMDGY